MIWVLTGPESCGKTTLAQTLSKQLRWPVLPEIARAYLTQRAIDTAQGAYRYRPSDLIALVQAQGDQRIGLAPVTTALQILICSR